MTRRPDWTDPFDPGDMELWRGGMVSVCMGRCPDRGGAVMLDVLPGQLRVSFSEDGDEMPITSVPLRFRRSFRRPARSE